MDSSIYRLALEILSEKMLDPSDISDILNSELSLPNIKFPTMGGNVFWITLAECNGWKLQQNDFTHHARILDNNDVRIAWGTINGMYKALDRLVASAQRYKQQESSSSSRLEIMEELKKLKELYDLDVITKSEYDIKKEKLMDRL